MTAMPVSLMWSWLPGSLPRVVLTARLPQKTRHNHRHDRHLPMLVATGFLHPHRRLSCRTLTETPGALVVVIAFPIQAP